MLLLYLETRDLSDSKQIEYLQDQAQMELAEYCSVNFHGQRFGKLLLVLPLLKNVDAKTIKKLYLKKNVLNEFISYNDNNEFSFEKILNLF